MANREGSAEPKTKKYLRLTQLLTEIANLQAAAGVLDWDQHTYMPKAGAQARGNQLAALRKVIHERLVSPEIGRLLEDLRDYEASLPYDSDEASTIRVARRQHEKAVRLPPDLVVRIARAESESLAAWLKAREARDYAIYRPALERTVDLARETAEALGYEDHPMDALLDREEPGMKVAALEALFARLRETLVPLARSIFERADAVDDSVLYQEFDWEQQLAASRDAVRAVGFDMDLRGRFDLTVHPFTESVSIDDTRITARVSSSFFNSCFFASLHEAGHGTYSQGFPPRFEQTILFGGASSGLHESQSRLWENVVGRSRAFWEFFYPRLRGYFPAQLEGVPVENFYRAVNKVKRSFIRVEADEVTYNLHVMVRHELEKAVFDGKLAVRDMAEAWKAKFEEYLGLTPPDDLVGVLQDVHWTSGFGAVFAGYTIGNVSAVQLYEKALEEYPDLPNQFARGEFSNLLGWMNRNVHAHGAKFTPQELLERVTGRPLDAEPYLRYIRTKFEDIYGL